jgi:hypothetical protein
MEVKIMEVKELNKEQLSDIIYSGKLAITFRMVVDISYIKKFIEDLRIDTNHQLIHYTYHLGNIDIFIKGTDIEFMNVYKRLLVLYNTKKYNIKVKLYYQ